MKNNELVKEILSSMEKEHINLYHDIDKNSVLSYISTIKNIDNLSPIEFDYEMLKLFALFKDSHTSYYIPWKKLDKILRFINEKFYIQINKKYKQILSIENILTEEFYKKLTPLINYETTEWLNQTINEAINNAYFYKMLGFDIENGIAIKTIDNEFISLKQNTNQQKEINLQNPKYYDYKILNDNILYFEYKACKENPDYPFANFISDMIKSIEKHNVKKYILDLRDNDGGNSEILNPFQTLVRDKNLNGVLLINNGVFSSGRFAVARFKKEFNTPLIGEPTGGAAKSYGFNKNLQIEDKHFSVSTRLWDFSNVFGYEGAIQPDIKIKTTIEDIKNKNKKIKKSALSIIKEISNNNKSSELQLD